MNYKSFKLAHHFLTGVIIFFLVFYIKFVAGALMAQIYNSQTTGYLDFWQQQKLTDTFVFQQEELQAVLQGADRAIHNLPESPQALLYKARVLMWAKSEGNHFKDQELNRAIRKYLEQAIRLRPAWPYTWAEYAAFLAQISAVAGLFEEVLLTADSLGPWEETVLENTVMLGFHYESLSGMSTVPAVENAFARLSHINLKKALAVAEQYNKKNLILKFGEKTID